MENKDPAEVEKRKEFFYGVGADGSFKFDGEEPIPVNRGIIAFHSSVLRNEFFGPEPKTQIEIRGFDQATFKLFLDCLLGFKEYTLLDALVIYPIAKEYKVTESQIKCVSALKPEVMDENLPIVLNLSVFYEDIYLTEYVIDFIKTKFGIINFLKCEKYSGPLNPPAMCKFIESVDLNSLIWTLVYQWGEKYVKDRNLFDVKSFFMENGILEKISLSHFESTAALMNFHETSKMQLFSNEEVFRLVKNNMLESPKTLPDKSDWVRIDAGYEFKETIVFKHYFRAYVSNLFDIFIRPNHILIESGASPILEIKAKYIFRHISSKNTQPIPQWRDDLHNFYREKLPVKSPKDYTISALVSSDEFDVNVTEDGGEPVYKIVIKTGKISMEFHAVEVTYKLKSSCRILKASLDTGKYSVDKDNLYFTKNVDISLSKEKDKDQK